MRFISDITVNLEQVLATDEQVLRAARVSTKGDKSLEQLVDNNDVTGVIKYLMKHRHGTPFEHNLFTFFVHAPIFVWREWHRHRIGFSYNEESGRYKKLEPVFYLPPLDRPMFKVDGWKPGKPKFLTIPEEHKRMEENKPSPDYIHMWTPESRYRTLTEYLTNSYKLAYESYVANLEMGFDPGLARDCLPLGIYSSCWVTCNARSLMAFISLRTHNENARDISYPLYEIEVAARKAEAILQEQMPITYDAFVTNGYRAP